MSGHDEQPGLFERPRVIKGICIALYVICALLLVADLFYTKHPHLGFDGWFAFYPLFGFGAYCVIVLGAKRLRPLLWRAEDYYHEDRSDAEQTDPGESNRD